jgi:GAF domain
MSWRVSDFLQNGHFSPDSEINDSLAKVCREFNANLVLLLVASNGQVSRSLAKCWINSNDSTQFDYAKRIEKTAISYLQPPRSDSALLQRIHCREFDIMKAIEFVPNEADCYFINLLVSACKYGPKSDLFGERDLQFHLINVFQSNSRHSACRLLLCGYDTKISDGKVSRNCERQLESLSLAILSSLPFSIQSIARPKLVEPARLLSTSQVDNNDRTILRRATISDEFLDSIRKRGRVSDVAVLVSRQSAPDRFRFRELLFGTWRGDYAIDSTISERLLRCGVMQFCLRKSRPVVVNLDGVSEEYFKHSADEVQKIAGASIDRYAAIPFELPLLNTNGYRTAGMLFCLNRYSDIRTQFDFNSLDVLKLSAVQLGHSIASDLLIEAATSLGNEFPRKTGILDETQPIVSITKELLTRFQPVLGFDNATLRLVNFERTGLDRVLSVPQKKTQEPLAFVSLSDDCVVSTVAREGRTILINDLLDPEQIETSVRPKNIRNSRSESCVPIRSGQTLLGVLNLESQTVNSFGARQRLIIALAKVIGNAYAEAVMARNDSSIREALINVSSKRHFVDNCQELYNDLEAQLENEPQFSEKLQALKEKLKTLQIASGSKDREVVTTNGDLRHALKIIENALTSTQLRRLRLLRLNPSLDAKIIPTAVLDELFIPILHRILERACEHGAEKHNYVTVNWQLRQLILDGKRRLCLELENTCNIPLLSEQEIALLYTQPFRKNDRTHWGAFIDGLQINLLGGSVNCRRGSSRNILQTHLLLPLA